MITLISDLLIKQTRGRRPSAALRICTTINVTRSSISNYETGRRLPDAETLLTLSKVLDYSFESESSRADGTPPAGTPGGNAPLKAEAGPGGNPPRADGTEAGADGSASPSAAPEIGAGGYASPQAGIETGVRGSASQSAGAEAGARRAGKRRRAIAICAAVLAVAVCLGVALALRLRHRAPEPAAGGGEEIPPISYFDAAVPNDPEKAYLSLEGTSSVTQNSETTYKMINYTFVERNGIAFKLEYVLYYYYSDSGKTYRGLLTADNLRAFGKDKYDQSPFLGTRL